MNRSETPIESLKGYLRQLSPQTRSRLLAEIERLRQSGEDVPGGDLLLGELRAEFRQDGRAIERLDQPARHFFRPLEPYLTDRPAERANAGQISRASLPPIWDWIGRDLMASMVRGYLSDMKQFIATGSSRYGEGDLLAVPGVRKDGTRLSLEFSIVPLTDADGGIAGVAALMRDVTARFEEMRELKRKLAALTGGAPGQS